MSKIVYIIKGLLTFYVRYAKMYVPIYFKEKVYEKIVLFLIGVFVVALLGGLR